MSFLEMYGQIRKDTLCKSSDFLLSEYNTVLLNYTTKYCQTSLTFTCLLPSSQFKCFIVVGGAAACRACTCQLGRGGKNADDVVLVAVAVVS